jgi:putative ABC transport system permease protein
MVRLLYRLLLYACPPAVRREYGAEMEAVFLHCVEVERSRGARRGRWLASLRGLIDLLVFAVTARWHGWGTNRRDDYRKPTRRSAVIVRDIRGTIRLMRSQPALTAGIVCMLALGIGATTAIFSVVYGVLLKPLPFPEPDRLVQISGSLPSRGLLNVSLTEANLWDIRDMNQSLSDFGAMHGASFTLTGFETPERVTGATVTVGFFRSLGVRPVVGRVFEPGEDAPGAVSNRALLSHVLWSRRFGSDRAIVGRAIKLDGRSYEVVGVLPAGSPWLDNAEVFVPFVRRANANRGSWEYLGIGRLKPGVSFDSARADLQRVAKELERFPENKGMGIALQSSDVWIASEQLRRTLWTLLGAVGLLLLIACVNVTNLLLARASARERENAVRTALGATRADLVRERLIESLIYSVAGAALGWLVATWMLGVLQSANPGGIPRLAEVSLNGWVMAFAAAAALAVGLLTGLVPAWRAPLGDIVPALRKGSRGAAGDRGQSRLRNVFVSAEVALSLVLLVGAGLLVRSLIHVLSVDRGFQTEQRLLATVSIPSAYPEERRAQIVTEVLARLEAAPEVVSVAAVSGRPISGGSTGLGIVAADHDDLPEASVPWATWRLVTKDYFKAIGLSLVAGRGFTEQDLIEKPWRVVISKRLADTLWPRENPIGKTAILWKGQSNRRGEVIGVISNMRERGLESDPTLAVYFPAYGALGGTTLQLVLHTKGRPEDAAPVLRSVVAEIDPTLPVSGFRTLEEIVTRSVATRRVTMLLLVTFAGVALMLALAGVYGVLAYSVARRTSEIGVRLALGAQHRGVLRLVVTQGMRPVGVGIVIGLAATFWLSRWMSSLLFEIQPHDPITYVTVSAVLIAIAALACYVPARRVLRVDPAIALRTE